jgi:hypothetical protein
MLLGWYVYCNTTEAVVKWRNSNERNDIPSKNVSMSGSFTGTQTNLEKLVLMHVKVYHMQYLYCYLRKFAQRFIPGMKTMPCVVS